MAKTNLIEAEATNVESETNLIEAEATNVESETTSVVTDSTLISNPLEPSASDSDSSNTKELEFASGSDDRTDRSDILSDCETPKANIFDPFTSASEKFALAPMKKISREFNMSVCRKLDFDCCVSPIEGRLEFTTDDEEELVLESLCQSFLDLIIANQSEAFFDSIDEQLYGHTTPAAVPCLTGIAARCPDAPLRAGPKSRMPESQSELSMCRKLDFESC